MTSHFHADEAGIMRRCYHHCKNIATTWQFWFGITVANTLEFIPEHLIWFRLWPFYLIARWLGVS